MSYEYDRVSPPPHRNHRPSPAYPRRLAGGRGGSRLGRWLDLRLDTWPDELTDISLSGSNANKVLSALRRLALPTLNAETFGLICHYLLACLDEDGAWLPTITSLFWRIHYDSAFGDRPLEFKPSTELYWFKEWENLIPDGYEPMTMDELCQRLRDFLQSYAAPDSAQLH